MCFILLILLWMELLIGGLFISIWKCRWFSHIDLLCCSQQDYYCFCYSFVVLFVFGVFVIPLEFCVLMIMFTSSLPVWVPLISLCCLISLPKISLSFSKSQGESIRSFTIKRVLAVGFSWLPFIRLRKFPSVFSLLSNFLLLKGVECCHIPFLDLFRWSCGFCSLFCQYGILHWLRLYVKLTTYPWRKFHLIMVNSFCVLLNLVG